jgi:uncharacterized protein YlxW (UPF0749 family)
VSGPIGLLEGIVRDALDPSYAEAAERRALERSSGAPAAGGASSRRWVGAALMVTAGAIAGLAVSFQHTVIPQVGAARSALAGDAGARSDQVKALERDVAARQREITQLQREQLQATASGRQLDLQASTLAAAAAQSAAQGSGITVTVADSGAGSVTDRDLQGVVNALWAAGAKAISVGGVRLGPQTAIRTAGQTILVDFKALRSPYVVAAIGSSTLLARTEESAAVTALARGLQGTRPVVTITADARLSLAATGAATTTVARPLTAGGHS